MPSLRALRRLTVLLVALLLSHPGRCGAQGTALVLPSDPAYADLDRLHDLGLLDSIVVGQRPYSEREFGRLVGIAARRVFAIEGRNLADEALVRAAFGRLEARFGPAGKATAPRYALVDEASLAATSTDAQRRPLLGNLGAPTEATIDPLADRRLGTQALRGHTLAFEVAQRAEPTGWLALTARERFEVRDPRDSGVSRQHAELLLASLRARYRNVALLVGREQTTLAQRSGDGLFLASDAPALDQVSIASEKPFVLPGFLSRLGPTKGTILLADLGASIVRSHSRLLLYKVSVTPVPALELGGVFEDHFLGAGHRPSSALNQFVDFFPFLDIFRKHNYTDTTKTFDVDSDKAIGGDARLTLAALGGLVVSGEFLIDDFDAHRLLALATNDGSQSLALTFPRLGTGSVSLELSAKHMGIFTYTHSALTNGMTTRGRLLGDELGPDAKAFGATLGWRPVPSARITVDARTALYSDATYFSVYEDSALVNYHIGKSAENANEQRDRLLVSVLAQPTGRFDLFARVGGERIRNARYYGDRCAYRIDAGLTLRP